MSELIQITMRSFASFLALFIFTKIMGRKELAQMSIFDYIVGISIGAIGAQMAFDVQEPWYEFMIVMVIYVGLSYLLTLLTVKSLSVRKFVDGCPIILLQDGKIVDKNLMRVRYDINTFLEECRLAGYFDISKISYAIMESNGRMSFLPKATSGSDQLVANLIIDGKILPNNLKAIDKDEKWLKEIMIQKGVKNIEEILLLTVNSQNKVEIYYKHAKVNVDHCLE